MILDCCCRYIRQNLDLLDDASWARINLPVGVEAEIRWAISPPAFIKDAGQNPQSFSSAPVSLPAGWREQRASTGRVYYVSPTGISQWHPPIMVVLHQSPPQQAVRSSSQALDPQQPQQKSQKPDKIEQIGKAVEVTGKTLDVVGQLVNLIGSGQGANQ